MSTYSLGNAFLSFLFLQTVCTQVRADRMRVLTWVQTDSVPETIFKNKSKKITQHAKS